MNTKPADEDDTRHPLSWRFHCTSMSETQMIEDDISPPFQTKLHTSDTLHHFTHDSVAMSKFELEVDAPANESCWLGLHVGAVARTTNIAPLETHWATPIISLG